jgi:ribonucleoside-diphosphate reductase alpha chain
MLKQDSEIVRLDWDKLRTTVHTSVRFLDNIIEINRYPLPEIARMSRGNRKIGLGVMGFAEMLIRVGVSYDSNEAIDRAERVMAFIAQEAKEASAQLAEQRGVFPNWPQSCYALEGMRLRNSTCTAIAPTGTIGILAGTSPSIEPLFALAYRRKNVLEGETLVEINPLVAAEAERAGADPREWKRWIAERGTLSDLPDLPRSLRRLFATALEIPPEQHLQIQAAFQRHVDNSVSKTINLPAAATEEEVAHVYQRAWELELKGITIYRYGSRADQVLELGVGEDASQYDHAAHCDPGECRL